MFNEYQQKQICSLYRQYWTIQQSFNLTNEEGRALSQGDSFGVDRVNRLKTISNKELKRIKKRAGRIIGRKAAYYFFASADKTHVRLSKLLIKTGYDEHPHGWMITKNNEKI